MHLLVDGQINNRWDRSKCAKYSFTITHNNAFEEDITVSVEIIIIIITTILIIIITIIAIKIIVRKQRYLQS